MDFKYVIVSFLFMLCFCLQAQMDQQKRNDDSSNSTFIKNSLYRLKVTASYAGAVVAPSLCAYLVPTLVDQLLYKVFTESKTNKFFDDHLIIDQISLFTFYHLGVYGGFLLTKQWFRHQKKWIAQLVGVVLAEVKFVQ